MVALLGGGVTGRVVIVRLPEVPLPAWTSGVRLGGAVTLEGVLAAVYEGMRLAAILACLGAANALASPRRLLRYVPATLYEVGTAVVVALTFAPQMVEDAARVRAARRLRGHSGRGMRELGRLAVPVLVGLARALARASRRRWSRAATAASCAGPPPPPGSRECSRWLACSASSSGLYGLLDATSPALLGVPMLVAGVLSAAGALVVGARRDRRTRYRRDPWGVPEWLVSVCGLVPAATLSVGAALVLAGRHPPAGAGGLPPVPLGVVASIAVAALAGVLAPVPPLLARSREAVA